MKAWSNSIVRKPKLNRIEFLTSKVLINSVIGHADFDLINNVLKEYDEMKEKTSKKKVYSSFGFSWRQLIEDFNLFTKQCYHIDRFL